MTYTPNSKKVRSYVGSDNPADVATADLEAWEASELDPSEELVEINLSTEVLVDSEGFWEPLSENFPVNENERDPNTWHAEDSKAYLGDSDFMLDKLDVLIGDSLKELAPGKYQLSGKAELVFKLEGAHGGADEGGDMIYNVDYVEVNFLPEKSRLVNFRVEPVS